MMHGQDDDRLKGKGLNQHRIHVFGASGSGASTLGRVLAARLEVPHLDADDYYWQLTELPYTVKNPPELRVRRLLEAMDRTRTWVLSGSVVSWGDAFIPLFTLAVFVTLPQAIRLERLRRREGERYGSRIEPGGDRYEASQTFLNWAALYDTAGLETRSKTMHEAWLRRLPCPVMRVESLQPPEDVAAAILSHVEG